MLTGHKGQKRPAEAISNTIRVAQIATGEADEGGLRSREAC